MRIALAGADGFVGRFLRQWAFDMGWYCHCIVRSKITDLPAGWSQSVVDDLSNASDMLVGIHDLDAVINAAGRAHRHTGRLTDSIAKSYERDNCTAALNLWRQARSHEVRHFVQLSTIKVLGECTKRGQSWRVDDEVRPIGVYATSKARMEDQLFDLADRTGSGIQTWVLRPVLMHGPGVKGNLAKLMAAVDSGWPLPLKGIENRRSVLAVENLISAINFLISRQVERGGVAIHHCHDGVSISTSELVRQIAICLNRSPRLLPSCKAVIRSVAECMGKDINASAIFADQVVDDTPLRRLGWHPPISTYQGISAMVDDWKHVG